MKRSLLSIFIATFAFGAYGQPADTKLEGLGSNTAATRTFDNRDINLKGTPYLAEDFQPGTMKTRRGTVMEDLALRLDIFQNELQMRKANNREIIIDKKTVDEFTIQIGSNKRTFRNVAGKYFEVVYEGPITILAEKKKKFEKASLGDHYSQQDYDEYTDIRDTFFLQIQGGELIEVKKSKKEFVKTYPVHQNEVKALIDEQKLKPNRREDLIKIVAYSNNLQS